MDTIILTWLVCAVGAALIELITPGFVFGLAGTAGALAAAAAAWQGADLAVQVMVFVGVSLVGIVVSRGWIARIQKARLLPTNMAAVIGKQALVIKAIPGPLEPGLVKIRGEVWTAYAMHEAAEGALVEVVSVSGCHLVVKEVK